ncbi:MAG: hypothetical protein HKN92_01715, partial [Chitinophagales bacterium]|nr:hypothetical protein [Chitinophagales bacterium]
MLSIGNAYGQCNACDVMPCPGNELVDVWDWDAVPLSESNRFSSNRIRDMFVNSVYVDDNLPITNDVIAFTLEYNTLNVDGSALVTASGTVLVPIGYPCAASPASSNCNLPWALYYKGTNVSGSTPSWAGEIPDGSGGTTMSVSGWDGFNFTFALALAANGYITVVPDYLGFGRNSLSGYHPYLHNDSEAQAGIDLLYAANEFLRRSPSEVLTNPTDTSGGYSICLPDTGQQSELFVYGHSQGGQSTMSFIKKTASCSNFPFEVKASATVSGAMDAYFNS